MIRILPFILIPILILGGLGYLRYSQSKQNLTTAQPVPSSEAPIEVPKTLPQASLEDKVKALDDTVNKLVTEVNRLKSSIPQPSSADSQINLLDASVTELKARVSALEKATPQAATSSHSTVYIPLGSSGQVSDTNWSTLNTFQINLDPAQYSGYSNMQLEVNMRLNQPGGTLTARLYDQTSASAVSSEATTTSTSSTVQTTSTFRLSSGSKTYVLQAKTSDGSQAFLDYARIKVNF